MSGNRSHAAPRTTQGRKRRAPAMQNQMEEAHPSENGFAPLPEKRRARGSGVALQPTSSTRRERVALNTVATSATFHTQGASSSDASRFSSVKASTPNPEHQPLAFVKAEVDQEMNMMMVKDEAPQTQAAPELAALPPADQECYRIFHYDLPRRLHHEFFLNNEQVDLEKMERFEHTDAEFGNWTSFKILQFFASVLPAKLMDIYKSFKFPSQLIEHLNSRELYINNQECQVFWYELIGMSDDDYDKVLKGLWKLKYGSEDGYEEWRGKDVNLKKEMDVSREEFVSLDYVQEGKAEEEQVPGANEEVEEEEPKDRWSVDPEANLDEEDEDEKQIVEKEGEVYLEPKFFEEAPMANANGAVPRDEPASEQKCEQIQHHLNHHAQENFPLAPAPTAPAIVSHVPASHSSEEQQGNRVPASALPVAYPATPAQALPQAGEQQENRAPAPAPPVAHPAAPAQAPLQVRPPLDAPRFDAERLSELLRLGIFVLSPPADPARIEVQAPPRIVEQEVLAPAPPDAPPAVQAPLLGGWQQGLGVPAPAPPDALPVVQAPLQGGWQQGLGVPAPAIPDAPPVVQAPLLGGWQQALGYWAPPPQAAPPAIPAIPDAWIPRQEGAYGRMPMLCMAMQDLRRAQFQAALQQREQQFPGINAPPPAAAPPIPQHVQGLPQGLQQLRPGILSPPLPAPAPIDQHLGVQAPSHQHQHRFPGFRAPASIAVAPPMAPRVQAPPLFHQHSHLVLVPRDGQPYAPPLYRPLQ